MSDHVEHELGHLPEPEPPAAFSRAVMARVSRLAEERATARLASQSSKKGIAAEGVKRWMDLAASAAALAGLAIVLVSWIDAQVEAGWSPNLWSWQLGAQGVMSWSQYGPSALALALGLLFYLAGAFAPLRGARPHHNRV